MKWFVVVLLLGGPALAKEPGNCMPDKCCSGSGQGPIDCPLEGAIVTMKMKKEPKHHGLGGSLMGPRGLAGVCGVHGCKGDTK